MSVAVRQAIFMLPDDLLNELKQLDGQRQQSCFVAEAVRKELQREKMKSALQASFSAWKDEDHSELQEGVEPYVRSQRRSSRAERTQ